MKFSYLPMLIALLFSVSAGAQNLNDKILMTVAGSEVSAGEFIRMFKKSLEPGKTGDADSYLQLYVTFKMKVADAISEGIDTTKAFKNELKGYRDQLAQNYLTDKDTREKLLQKTYQRYLTEINAWHILVSCPEGTKPQDTLKAWKKAIDIRERINKGESFEQVARGTSDDPSVKINGGNLGFFSVFQMITPFEDAAYNLKKGMLSQPVRTPYGYHIIKVAERRPSKGKILAAHIMKVAPPGTNEKDAKAAEDTINSIYRQLLEGASFSDLARKYSDHKESAVHGGNLDWFGAGELITELSETAFAISDTGNFSKPVRTPYAWHIIKLLDRKATGTFEETRSFLESKLNQSYLNSLSKKSFVEKLKKEYNFRINQVAYKWFVENTDTLIMRGEAKYDRSKIPSGNLYSFTNQRLTNRDFAAYIERRGLMIVTNDPVSFIKQSIEAMVSDQIVKYENSVLEKKYPDFGYLMTEFHDGILLFEISGRRVWNRVQEDSAGLHDYYEDHKNEFLTRKAMDAKIYTLRDGRKDRKLLSCYRKYSDRTDCDSLMRRRLSRDSDTLLIIKEGRFEIGDDIELDRIKWTIGTQSAKLNNYPSLVVIKRIFEPEPRPLEEVQGEIMTGYQEYLENEWIRQLKQKYTVKIDNLVLNEIKNNIRNE